MSMPTNDHTRTQTGTSWKVMLGIGLALILLGALGLGAAGLLTLASVLWFGAMLMAAGVLLLIQAFRSAGWGRSLGLVVIGLLYLLVGLYAVWQPQVAAGALTLLAAIGFLLTGALRLLLAWQWRQWVSPWMTALTGVLGMGLGVLILIDWPGSSVWLLGMLLAIELLLNGWMLVWVALTLRAAR